MKIRICTKCNRELPATPKFFYRMKSGKYGLKPYCKQCQAKYDAKRNREYREKRKDEIKKKEAQYYEENKERLIKLQILHDKIRDTKKKQLFCTICNQPKKLELASIGHTYTENPNDYIWLCHSCHALFDSIQRGVILEH